MSADDYDLTTYKRADGEMIADEFGWVADIDYFEDLDEPIKLVREDWRRIKRIEFWHPDFGHCAECGEDVPLPDDYDGKMLLYCADPECITERESAQNHET